MGAFPADGAGSGTGEREQPVMMAGEARWTARGRHAASVPSGTVEGTTGVVRCDEAANEFDAGIQEELPQQRTKCGRPITQRLASAPPRRKAA
jgi:hypothetical protein